jgi:hypothetical protein
MHRCYAISPSFYILRARRARNMNVNPFELKESEPIEITTDGAVISGLKIHNPNGFAMIVKANHVTIQECDITGAINLYGPVQDILIQNNYIHDLEPDGDANNNKQICGITTTEGDKWNNPIIQPMGASNITIRGNYFENCSTGTMLVDCKGPITFRGNYSRNPRGPFPRGQMVQISCCDGSTGLILIENNFSYVDSELPEQLTYHDNGRWGVEDHINIYNTSGSEIYPITVRNNYVTGRSASVSGCGITLGDAGGSYYHIVDNKVYHTGNAGIALGGGHHWFVKGNRIYQMPAGPQYDGRGLQIECYGEEYDTPIFIENNIVYWDCGKRSGNNNASLFCAYDSVIFKNNSFGKIAAFDYLDPMPAHEPPEPVEGLIKPWESAK